MPTPDGADGPIPIAGRPPNPPRSRGPWRWRRSARPGSACIDFKDLDQGDYRKTRERLGRPADSNRGAPIPGGRKPRARETGSACDSALRGKVDALADEGRGIADFAAFQSRLSEADGLARLVDRGEDPPASSAVEPSSRYRQARVHDFLIWMADRTWRDHWYSEKPTAPPYYQAIVARLFNDAQGLFPELREADQKRPRGLAHGADWPSKARIRTAWS